jgi:hypothetical protein
MGPTGIRPLLDRSESKGRFGAAISEAYSDAEQDPDSFESDNGVASPLTRSEGMATLVAIP